MNGYEKRKLKDKEREELLQKYNITYIQYRKIYVKWKAARARGHDITLEYYIQNKDLVRIALYKDNPIRVRENILKKYGLTIQSYNEILESQNGRCAICKDRPLKGKNLSVDHCHKTQVVRGLLCATCNSGLGMFRDDIFSMENAVEYLKKAKAANS